eukprot:462229-Pelagomonas_calceolata.AAC.3
MIYQGKQHTAASYNIALLHGCTFCFPSSGTGMHAHEPSHKGKLHMFKDEGNEKQPENSLDAAKWVKLVIYCPNFWLIGCW